MSADRLIIERRSFCKLGLGFGLSCAMGWVNPVLARETRVKTTYEGARNSARSCLFISLRGAPSHIDTFDLKTGKWTPDWMQPTRLPQGYDWPAGLMPQLTAHAGKFSIVRSLVHEEAAHERAQYYLETGRRLNPGLRNEIPHIGAVIAYDFEKRERRRATDTFPGYVNLSGFSYSETGFLPANYTPFKNDGNLYSPDGQQEFDARLQILKVLNEGEAAPYRQPLPLFQEQAERMVKDPMTLPTFGVEWMGADHKRYGDDYFAYNLVVARNILRADRGTRYIEVSQFGWDHHQEIYTSKEDYGFRSLSRKLDQGLSALLTDLSATPGSEAGKSLLDETLIVVAGEFGRTVGNLNEQAGRDHYPDAFSALFAGGGVKGGRVIGATDQTGGRVVDPGWSHGRPVHLPDLITTIYSALGIEYSTVVFDTPSGRPFLYVDWRAIGDEDSYEISGLF